MNNLNDLTERFLEVYERLLLEKKITNLSDFAKKVGISNSMMTEIVKKRSNVGIKVIQNTVNTFDMISPDWILTGEGKMLKQQKTQHIHDLKNDYHLKLEDFVDLLKQNNMLLTENIEHLKLKVSELEKEITTLKKE
ncbi:MAG: hypothetical protein AUJ53_02800 [Flavobacteriaceae bacterium CG1_02_35_72]|nr:MAG: hypothetical protein AUJ53_02800 [Flavobacteriaceae bacterium CG1_02_35_72]